MNSVLRKYLLGSFAIFITALAERQARADFSGPYAPPNWTFTQTEQDPDFPANGSFTNDGSVLTITGSDTNQNTGWSNTDYTIAAAASGTWSFDWSYTTLDVGYESGGYLLNGIYTILAGQGWGPIPGSGSVSISVAAGDVIGFRAHSVDNQAGAATLTITNFVGPVPAPGALALLGIAGLVGSRRRRS